MLTHPDVSGADIDEEELSQIVWAAPNMQHLKLRGTQLRVENVAYLAQHLSSSLVSLSLEAPSLKLSGLMALQQCKKLASLSFEGKNAVPEFREYVDVLTHRKGSQKAHSAL